jgi:hypothetical protein
VLLGLTVLFVGLAVGMSLGIENPTPNQAATQNWLFGLAGSSLSGLAGIFTGSVI